MGASAGVTPCPRPVVVLRSPGHQFPLAPPSCAPPPRLPSSAASWPVAALQEARLLANGWHPPLRRAGQTPSPLSRFSVAWFEFPSEEEVASHTLGDKIREDALRIPSAKGVELSDDDESTTRTGEGDIESAGILSEPSVRAVIGARHGHDDEVFLPTLICIHAGYLRALAQGVS